MQPARINEEYIEVTLENIINAWTLCWLEEKGVFLDWLAYQPSDVRRRLTGFFQNSSLWNQGACGLDYLDENSNRMPVERDTRFADPVYLRGTLVICTKQKVACSKTGRFHHKHPVHISEVYNDLIRYARRDQNLAALVKHLDSFRLNASDEVKTVYFSPKILLETLSPLPVSSRILWENLTPVYEGDEINQSSDQASDQASDHVSEVSPPSEEDEEELRLTDNISESLSLVLKLYVAAFSKCLQDGDLTEKHEYADKLFDWTEKLEESQSAEGFNTSDEMLYHIALLFCALDVFSKETASAACDAIKDDYLINLIAGSKNAYYFYCLSVIALKVNDVNLSVTYINQSMKFLTDENEAESESALEIKQYNRFIQEQNFQTTAVLYSGPRVDSQRISMKLLRKSINLK